MNQNNELMNKISTICASSNRNRHSYFQLQYFVIGKEPTIQAKIEACRRELNERASAIENFLLGIEELYDKKAIEELTKLRANEQLDNDVNQIHYRQSKRKIKLYDKQIDDLNNKIIAKQEEANFLIGLYERLCEVQSPKDWDSLEVQTEYWNARLTRDLEAQLLLSKPNEETFKTILAMPDNVTVKSNLRELIQRGRDAVNKNKLNSNEAQNQSI